MKKIILIILVLAVLLLAAIGVKMIFFRPVNNAWFAMNRDNLPKVPPGLVIFRPTHFHDNLYKQIVAARYQHDGQEVEWFMGRDLPLRIAIAVAYKVNRAIVVLPADAPTGHFDFLLTTLDDPQVRLQAAIRHKLGLTGQMETRPTDVLAIKVEDPNLSHLAVSAAGEDSGVTWRKGELHFTHMRISELTDEFERVIEMPVVNETGLTNYYDFSIPWNRQTARGFMLEATSRDTVEKMLNKLGLTLQATNEPVEVFVVKHD